MLPYCISYDLSLYHRYADLYDRVVYNQKVFLLPLRVHVTFTPWVEGSLRRVLVIDGSGATLGRLHLDSRVALHLTRSDWSHDKIRQLVVNVCCVRYCFFFNDSVIAVAPEEAIEPRWPVMIIEHGCAGVLRLWPGAQVCLR